MDLYFNQLARIWWNELSREGRRFVLGRAMAEPGKASPYEAFNLRRVGKVRPLLESNDSLEQP